MLEQEKICSQNGVELYPALSNQMIGVSDNFGDKSLTNHGLRHAPEKGTCGWYLWSGDYSQADDFFKPMHVSHMESKFPNLVKFLGLPPGWRFLVGDDHEDIWFDASLLDLGNN